MKLQITSFLQDRQLTVALSGEIDHHGAKTTLRMIADKIDQFMPMQCTLDFRGVTFMDSSGIAIVIHTLRRMLEFDGKLKLSHVPPQAMKVMDAAGLGRIVEIEGREKVHEM